ncbi:hypothetical protein [Nocardia sp. NPDC004604]|uniref:hypothetical protein n=1 Tax=Nocardia sp. NPDC004604 TaxID=3157013 RepID=UPI0033BC93F2
MDPGFLCLLVVIGIIALLVYNSNQKATNRFRVHCGECRYVSPWMTESAANADSLQHYETRHPAAVPGGHIESRFRK